MASTHQTLQEGRGCWLILLGLQMFWSQTEHVYVALCVLIHFTRGRNKYFLAAFDQSTVFYRPNATIHVKCKKYRVCKLAILI